MLRGAPPVQAVHDLIVEQLVAGAARGELAQDADVTLRAQMLFDAYLSNYPQAIFQAWTMDALKARSREQIRILLAGVRRG